MLLDRTAEIMTVKQDSCDALKNVSNVLLAFLWEKSFWAPVHRVMM